MLRGPWALVLGVMSPISSGDTAGDSSLLSVSSDCHCQ